MAYTVEISPSAERQLRNLPRNVQDLVRPRIRALATEPRPSGVVKMAGQKDTYRIRVGDYRVMYRIEDKVLLVSITSVGHRSNVYRR